MTAVQTNRISTYLAALFINWSAFAADTIEKDLPTVDIVRKVGPSVVLITANFPGSNEVKQGSGVLIKNKRTIITNVHVVEGAYSVDIHFPDGTKTSLDQYSAADEKRDLVCLKLPPGKAKSDAVKLADIASFEIGEKVVAIGNPKGLTNTVSEGIISGVREFEETVVLQTTAPLSQGSSGGGLFNSNGELIGITTFLFEGGQNLNFALPVEYVYPLINKYGKHNFSNLQTDYSNNAEDDYGIPVFVTRSGTKFHIAGCRYLKRGAIQMPITDVSHRFLPCKICIGRIG